MLWPVSYTHLDVYKRQVLHIYPYLIRGFNLAHVTAYNIVAWSYMSLIFNLCMYEVYRFLCFILQSSDKMSCHLCAWLERFGEVQLRLCGQIYVVHNYSGHKISVNPKYDSDSDCLYFTITVCRLTWKFYLKRIG